MDREIYEEFVKENKRKKIGIFIALLIFVLLILLGILVYYKVLSKNYLKEIMINIFDYPGEFIAETKSLEGNYSIEFNGTTIDDENKLLYKILNNLDININVKTDVENKLLDFNFDSNYAGENFIDFSAYGEEERLYYYIDGVYDKYIRYDSNTLTEEIDIDLSKKEDYKIILLSIQKSLEANLKDEYFTKEKVLLDNKKVTRNIMNIDKNNCVEFEEGFYRYLLTDEEFINSYANIKNKEETEVKNEIQNYIEIVKQEPYQLIISLYNNYSNFVKLEIILDDEKLEITKNNNRYDFIYENDLTYMGSLEIEKNNEKESINFKIKDSLSRNIMNITIDGNFKTGMKLSKKDMSTSVASEEITEEELENMSKVLLENKGFAKLMEDILYIGMPKSLA